VWVVGADIDDAELLDQKLRELEGPGHELRHGCAEPPIARALGDPPILVANRRHA
jgi:hypothetical protein